MPNRKISPSMLLLITAVCMLSQSALHGQSTDSKARTSGSVSGMVTINDKGAPDVSVVAQSADRPSLQQSPIRARTDASGRYRLTGLAAGQFQIIALAPGLVDRDWSSLSGSNKSVVLAEGEDVDNVDVKLVRGSVITGRVTDPDGKPVIEERVNLQTLDANGSPSRANFYMLNYQASQTDDRGVYRIYGLPAGRYQVSIGVDENGYITPNNHVYYALTYYRDTSDAAKASIVELQEGSEAKNIDIHVGRASHTFIASGRVIDSETGQPVPGVRLICGQVRPNQPFQGSFSGMPVDSKGEFRLEGLEPGHYGVSIAATFDSSSYYSDPLLFEISDGDVSNLELKVTRGLILSGVVLFEGARARELQQGSAGLRVVANVSSAADLRSQGSSSSSTISADGTFHVDGVRPGRVRFFVGAMTSSALRGLTILRVERGGVDVTQSLEVQPGESISDLRIVATIGSGTIRGTVVFLGGPPPENARLFVNAPRQGGNSGGYAVVDARGHFIMSNLVPGTYSITLNGSLSENSRRGVAQTQLVNVTDGSEVDVTFTIDVRESRP